MKDALLIELADTWDVHAAHATTLAAAETLRACADTLRMLVDSQKPPPDCPHAAPFRYCQHCKVDPCPLGFKGAKAKGE